MKRRNWAPYLLILPSAIYLALFFAWPMVQALGLAVWDDDGLLELRAEPDRDSDVSGLAPRGQRVTILDRQGNLLEPENVAAANLLTEVWFLVSGEGAGGETVAGWTSQSRVRVREEGDDGTPLAGTIRPRLGVDASDLTDLHEEPNESSAVVGQLEERSAVSIEETATLEVWYRLEAERAGESVTGWAPSRFVQLFGDETTGRIDRGNTGQFTTDFLSSMVNDRFFMPALGTTVLLMLFIIPAQFVLAIIMALVIQARLRGNSLFLYVFAIPLGISDLAVGIVWFAIFTRNGFLNSFLDGLGLIAGPQTFLSADKRYWILIAIILAEIWRATSIVMVIVVSGLQAISQEVLEAAEIFGASLWQRLRYIILPLLRPSLQVALILRTILAFQVFAVVIALSGGDIVTVLANETYRQYVEFRNPNVAAAYAALILLLSMVSAVIYLRLVRTQEELVT